MAYPLGTVPKKEDKAYLAAYQRNEVRGLLYLQKGSKR